MASSTTHVEVGLDTVYMVHSDDVPGSRDRSEAIVRIADAVQDDSLTLLVFRDREPLARLIAALEEADRQLDARGVPRETLRQRGVA